MSLAGGRPKEDGKPRLLFSGKINSVFSLGFILMFSGYCDRMLKEWEGIQESSFGDTAAGKRYKGWERAGKCWEKAMFYLTKDEQDGENWKGLGHRGRMCLRKQVVEVFAASGNVLFAVPTTKTSGNFQTIWALTFLRQILLTDPIAELTPTEKLQKVAAMPQFVT